MLCKGSFGEIVAVNDSLVDKVVVVEDEHAMLEVYSLQDIDHPNVLRLISYSKPTSRQLVMRFPRYDMDLSKWIGQGLVRNHLHIATQIARGLAAVHEEGYFHRDLKASNVFVLKHTEEVVIGDFGWSRRCVPFRCNTLPVTTKSNHAPEIVAEDGYYNASVDVYAYGMMLFELYNKSSVFQQMPVGLCHAEMLNMMYDSLFRFRYHCFKSRYRQWSMSEEMFALWKRCVDKNPSRRPRASSIECCLESF